MSGIRLRSYLCEASVPPPDEARAILAALGLPRPQQNEIAAYTLMALVGLGPDERWDRALPVRTYPSAIISFVSERYDRSYRENTRETIRRQVLHQMMQAGVVVRNPDEPGLPTNSPRTRYALTEEALAVVRSFGTLDFDAAAMEFRQEQAGGLAERYARPRKRRGVVVRLPSGDEVVLSPGTHNELQRRIVEEFLLHFIRQPQLLYLGDTDEKGFLMETEQLLRLGVPVSEHGKLPDVVAYDPEREWLFLCEAVTSHGPVSPKRYVELEDLLSDVTVKRVYISAFPDFREYRKHAGGIAWETEVWVAEQPSHLLHYDGEHFISPAG